MKKHCCKTLFWQDYYHDADKSSKRLITNVINFPEPIVDTSSSGCTAKICKKTTTEILAAGCAQTCNIKNPPAPSRGWHWKQLIVLYTYFITGANFSYLSYTKLMFGAHFPYYTTDTNANRNLLLPVEVLKQYTQGLTKGVTMRD